MVDQQRNRLDRRREPGGAGHSDRSGRQPHRQRDVRGRDQWLPDEVWRPRPNAVWTTNVFRSGAASFEVRGPAPDAYSDQAVQLRPGTRYTLTYWVRTTNAAGPGVSVRYSQLSPNPLTLILSPAISGSRAWTQVTVSFTTPANYVNGRVDIRWDLTGGYAWIDDMMLYEDPA